MIKAAALRIVYLHVWRVIPSVGPGAVGVIRGTMMFFYRVRLFSLFGFDVYVDASWLLLAVLIAWTLATGVFPGIVSGLASATY
jgi:hypothetical protein